MTVKQTVLILGAGSDMALATACEFARRGFEIVLSARNLNKNLEEYASDISIRYGAKVHLVQIDALDYESHDTFYDRLPAKPNVTICFIGLLGCQEKAKSDLSQARKVMATNFLGVSSLLLAARRFYLNEGKGTIIGVSSVAGDRGRQSNFVYGASKSGFSAFLAGLRNELFHHGIHVMTVKPGFVYTQMTKEMNLPKVLTTAPASLAKDIWGAYQGNKNIIYSKRIWYLIMIIIKLIPESVFKRLKM